MVSSSKAEKREAFMEMARRIGDLPTSALASGEPLPAAPAQPVRVAETVMGRQPAGEPGPNLGVEAELPGAPRKR